MHRTAIAADVGGTKVDVARIALPLTAPPVVLERARYASASCHGAADILARFERDTGVGPSDADAGCFAVAGPTREGRAHPPHLAWGVSVGELAATGLRHARVVNDLAATAAGLAWLPLERVVTLHQGDPDPEGHRAVVAPGTGLGVAALSRLGGRWHPTASEGGHATYAPQRERSWRLRGFLARRHGHVSWERVVSGPGLAAIWAFLGEDAPSLGDPAVSTAIAASGDASAAISRAALAGRCPRCVMSLELFAEALGAFAGDVALRTLATAGIYIAGGIPPKVLPALRRPALLDAFFAKGRFEPLLRRVPVLVVDEPATALFGAASVAADALDAATTEVRGRRGGA